MNIASILLWMNDLLSDDPMVRLEAGRELAGVTLPDDLRPAVIRLLFDDRAKGPESLVRWPVRAAAEALMQDPRAYELALPLFATPDMRAEMVLSAAEKRLAKRLPVDPRFQALAEAHPAMGRGLARAFAGFVPSIRRVELGEGDDPPFPFFVAGVATDEQPTLDFEPPPGLAVFAHQFGGLSCLQTSLLGYAVAVPPHLDVSTDVWLSSGEPLDPATLAALAARLPFRPTGGHEALLEAKTTAPLSALRGFDVLSIEPEAAWHELVDLSDPNGLAKISRCGVYDERHEHALERLGLGVPYVSLLWGNSD